jgi:hypothetical protein
LQLKLIDEAVVRQGVNARIQGPMRGAQLQEPTLDLRRIRRCGHDDLHAISITLDPDCRARPVNILEIQARRNPIDAGAPGGRARGAARMRRCAWAC